MENGDFGRMISFSKWWIFRFHLSFQGCTWCFGLTFAVSEKEHFKDVDGFFLRFQCQ